MADRLHGWTCSCGKPYRLTRKERERQIVLLRMEAEYLRTRVARVEDELAELVQRAAGGGVSDG